MSNTWPVDLCHLAHKAPWRGQEFRGGTHHWNPRYRATLGDAHQWQQATSSYINYYSSLTPGLDLAPKKCPQSRCSPGRPGVFGTPDLNKYDRWCMIVWTGSFSRTNDLHVSQPQIPLWNLFSIERPILPKFLFASLRAAQIPGH